MTYEYVDHITIAKNQVDPSIILKPNEDVCYSDAKTLIKVSDRLFAGCGMTRKEANKVIRTLQNAGILFREPPR